MVIDTQNRSLLFGVLAVHTGLVQADVLIACMERWASDKSRPLSDFLVQQGVLAPDCRDVLEALVAEHLRQNQQDATKSLAAVGPLSVLRARLERIVDPDSTRAPDQAPDTASPDPSTADPYATMVALTQGSGVVAAPAPGAARFRIVRSHARGGLGEVFVADDRELHREVALKEIQSRHADHLESRARFLLEAEITGGLEHPGIVPVYGLGTYPDGRPYYAMRFIKGASLKEAIEQFYRPDGASRDPAERAVELRKLLGRFLDVCNAMEYAHSRGILHRDLKPGNIMLGNYGETLVVDWGLAKPIDRPDLSPSSDEPQLHPPSASATTATQMGSALGTPQFMSPEQAAGDLDRLGPASDVYSLGATLYNILTGQTAFQDRDLTVLLSNVKRGIFPPPRKLNPRLPRPLEAICLKAMAQRPEDRYPTPRPLADELEHWLADEPVSAYQEPWHERLRRFARRHRTWTQAVAASLVIVTVTAVAASVIINGARQRETLARADAERSFQQARETVDDFFTRVSESKLLNVPGLQPLRRELLDEAARYYRGFIEQRGQDPAVRAELANTYYRLGLIGLEVGTKAESLQALNAAADLQQQLVASQPQSREYRELLANIRNAQGNYYLAAGQSDAAAGAFDAALNLRKKLVQEQPQNQQFIRKLANSYNNMALLPRSETALKNYALANGLREQLVRENPDAPQFRRDLAQGYYNLGVLHRDQSNISPAAKSLRQAADAYRQLALKTPQVIDYQRELSISCRVLADLLVSEGQMDEAKSLYDEAGKMSEQLARQNPFLLALQADVAAVYVSRGKMELRAARLPQALDWFQRARAIQEQLAAADAQEQRYQADLAGTLLQIGLVRLAGGELKAARESFDAAIAEFERLQSVHPEDMVVQIGLAQAHTDLGLVERNEQRSAVAVQHFQQELAAYQRLAASQPHAAEYLFGQADAMLNIAVEQRSAHQPQDALTTLGEANKLQLELNGKHPGIAKYQQLASEILYLEGLLRYDQGSLEEAFPFYERALKLRQELATAQPDNMELQTALGVTFDEMSVMNWRLERDDDAAKCASAAAVPLKLAVERAPAIAMYRRNLANHLTNQATLDRESGRPEAAARRIAERRALWPDNPSELVQVAAEWALTAASLEKNAGQLLPDQQSLQRQCKHEAVAALQQAVAAGFKDFDRLQQDPRLAGLRELPAFQEVIRPMKQPPGEATPRAEEK